LEEQFLVVLPKNHPLVEYNKISVDALANEAFIIHPRNEGPTLYDGFIRLCQQFGFQPNIIQESISLQTRVCLVAAGIGITFVSEYVQPPVCRRLESRFYSSYTPRVFGTFTERQRRNIEKLDKN
jgi:DNA-binding transcriptional LysR family regulator